MKIKLFVVSHCPSGASQIDFNKNICAVVPKKKDAKEYVKKKYIIDHFEHYESWCALRALDDESLESEDAYFEETANEDIFDEYTIAAGYYNKRRIAAALRISAWMLPVGASYEEPFELEVQEKLFGLLAQSPLENADKIHEA